VIRLKNAFLYIDHISNMRNCHGYV